MKDNFLLQSPLAERLYKDFAESLPVIDYHNHLAISDIVSDKQFDNIFDLWIKNDPYKHRAMRICGVDEKYITGDAEPFEKFSIWSETLPKLVGNPLYHWTDMELKRVFDIDIPLNKDTASEIWEHTNNKLKDKNFSAQSLLKKFNVEYSAPCTSIIDDISVFDTVRDFVAPSLRGDDMVVPDANFIEKLNVVSNTKITDFDSYMDALEYRISKFDSIGCKFSDHAIDAGFTYKLDQSCAESAFLKILSGHKLTCEEINILTSAILMNLGGIYAKFGWTVQLHIGALRYTSTRLRDITGPAGGYAGIGSTCDVFSIVRLIDDIEKKNGTLPKFILFTLNPADNAVMSVLTGSFSADGLSTRVSQGPAWWWCDHIYGIREVLENISSFGVLSTFVGMTTDSRSILSFVRHEYFRRILCSWMGDKVVSGEFPDDMDSLKYIINNVCYKNAKECIK